MTSQQIRSELNARRKKAGCGPLKDYPNLMVSVDHKNKWAVWFVRRFSPEYEITERDAGSCYGTRRHCLDGPALVVEGKQLWYRHGVVHRVGGPALHQTGTGRPIWVIDGRQLDYQPVLRDETWSKEEEQR